MTITLLTGPSGAGKSQRLIESVKSAQANGRRVATFMAREAIVLSADPNVWRHGVIGCRADGVECTLDHLVSSRECADILEKLPPGALVAVDEARFFGPETAEQWIAASRRGLELLISTPSREHLAALSGVATEVRLSVRCMRCRLTDAVSSLVLPGAADATSLCAGCEAELVGRARDELITRLRAQAPYPGEEALYQPVELEECASWRVLRVDSARRVELMTSVIEEVTARDADGPLTYLDLGCNTGYFCHAMAKRGFAAYGMDVVSEDIEVAELLTAFVRRDFCRYTVADIHDYLDETRTQQVDVISAFSVIQWLISQRSLDAGMEALQWLFEKTSRICVLEMGYASEEIYRNLLPAEIDREWVRRCMEDSGAFQEVSCYPADEHGLMRDLFIGVKPASAAAAPSVLPGHKDDPVGLSGSDDSHRLVDRLTPLLRNILRSDRRLEIFRLLEARGIHLLPVDFYEPIPDTGALPSELWESASDLVGIDLEVDAQIALLADVFPRIRHEYDALPREEAAGKNAFYLGNGMFDGTDALAYYCMIRCFRPKRIVEVGTGYSTRLAAQAALRNGNTTVVAVDPYPGAAVAAGFPGLSRLEKRRVEEVELSFFEELKANDILFVDSSHVSRIGGDVNFLFLEVLPRLAPGVLVHIHDIFLPLEYSREWVVDKGRFWNEQYLLQAFLAFNKAWKVVLANQYLGLKHREALQQAFPNSPWWGGGSFWMRRHR